MTPDPLLKPIQSEEQANQFLEQYVQRANSALHAFWSQVGPLQPTMIYETILQMEKEGRLDISTEIHKTNMEMMKSVLRSFSEAYEITARLKEEIDKYMQIPAVKDIVEATNQAEAAKQQHGGRLN